VLTDGGAAPDIPVATADPAAKPVGAPVGADAVSVPLPKLRPGSG
jgi:hypothetical protein